MPEKKIVTASCANRMSFIQCFNCQRWGHLSIDCRQQTRCVKCGLGRRASECPKKADAPPSCANCQGRHTSAYRGCVAAPKSRRSRRPKHRRPHRIPGLSKKTNGTQFTIMCKLKTEPDFLSKEQIDRIANEIVVKAVQKMNCPATPQHPVSKPMVHRVVQLQREPSHVPAPAAEVPVSSATNDNVQPAGPPILPGLPEPLTPIKSPLPETK